MDQDQYDLFLERCAKEVDLQKEYGKDGGRELAEQVCSICYYRVPDGSRHCPNCGSFQSLPDGILGTFQPKTIVKHNLAVSILSIEGGIEIEGKVYTRLMLKIQNLTQRRVHLSLTYVDSVLIDITGRQYSPVEADEFTEDPGEKLFPTWFYIYPDAFRDGVLLFSESQLPYQRIIVCAMHQENEDELFVFELNGPQFTKDKK